MATVTLSATARRAYKALQHCKVIRTRFDHPGFIELYEWQYADFKTVPGDENALDWKLL